MKNPFKKIQPKREKYRTVRVQVYGKGSRAMVADELYSVMPGTTPSRTRIELSTDLNGVRVPMFDVWVDVR